MYRIGIFGDTGMVGQEIEKVLENHDQVGICFRKKFKKRRRRVGLLRSRLSCDERSGINGVCTTNF